MVDILAIMHQNSAEEFGKTMEADVKMTEDMHIAVDKPRVSKQSVY